MFTTSAHASLKGLEDQFRLQWEKLVEDEPLGGL